MAGVSPVLVRMQRGKLLSHSLQRWCCRDSTGRGRTVILAALLSRTPFFLFFSFGPWTVLCTQETQARRCASSYRSLSRWPEPSALAAPPQTRMQARKHACLHTTPPMYAPAHTRANVRARRRRHSARARALACARPDAPRAVHVAGHAAPRRRAGRREGRSSRRCGGAGHGQGGGTETGGRRRAREREGGRVGVARLARAQRSAGD
jgi:hypothetical protein